MKKIYPILRLGWLALALGAGIALFSIHSAAFLVALGVLIFVSGCFAGGGAGALRVLLFWVCLGALRLFFAGAEEAPRIYLPAAVDDIKADVVEGRVSQTELPYLFVELLSPHRGTVRLKAKEFAFPGDYVRLRGLLRSARRFRFPGQKGKTRTDFTLSSARVEILQRGSGLFRFATKTRMRMAQEISRVGGKEQAAGVLRAMVLGDKGGLSHSTREAFRDSGASHILAVSGLHLAVVAGFFYFLLRFLWALLPWARFVPPHMVAALCPTCAAPITMVWA